MKTITTIADVQEATMKELVAFYNAHNVDAPVARFSDRKTAERRVCAVLESLRIIAEQGGDHETGTLAPEATVHKTRKSREVKPEAESPNAHIPEDEITEEQARAELELMKANKAKGPAKSASTGLSLSAAIAQSWQDPAVAQARMTRHGVYVTVNGKTAGFKSVRSAFGSLGLPDSKHIRFRMLVKAEGAAIFEWNGQKYHFSLTAPEGFVEAVEE